MKHLEFEFCMSQFKIAVIVITALVLVVLYWSITRYRLERFNPHQAFTLAAANTNTKAPPAGSIAINAKIIYLTYITLYHRYIRLQKIITK